MRKLKFNLGEGGFKGFLIRHVEKIVLFTAILLVAVFFCLGYSAEGLPANKTPSALKDLVNRVSTHIAKPTWAVIAPGRTPEMRHPERVDEGRKANEDRSYPLATLDLPPIRQKTLRTDPRLFKPIKLEVHGKYVSVAHAPASKTETDKIAMEEPAIKKARDSKKGPVKPKKTDKSEGSSDLLGPGAAPMPSGDEGSSMPYSGGLEDEFRQLTPAQLEQLKGFEAGEGAIAKSKYLVALKAVVPYRQQCEEFERCFSNSNEYDPMRDFPVYYWFYVERAEVPTDPAAPLVWTKLNTKQVLDMANPETKGGWWGVAEELADLDYTDEVLTLPIPPVLLDDLKMRALHSEVPERKDYLTDEPEESSEKPASDDGADGPSALPGTSREDGAPGSGPRSGRPGAPGMRPGMPGAPGMPGGRQPGMPGGRQPGMPSMTGGGKQPGMTGYPGGSRGSSRPGMPPGMMGGPGMMGSGESGAAEIPLPKYKLVRFYDLKAEPGKTYRYRMQVRLLDPNCTPPDENGQTTSDPSIPTLDPAVIARVKAQDAKDGGVRKTFWVDSEWSDPSDPISAPPTPQRMLAGGVSAPKPTILGTGIGRNTAPRYYEREPHMTVAASIWDEDRAVPVALELPELYRGSVLNKKTEVDVLHPVFKSFHTLKDYPFSTEAVLLDIRGGETLPDQKADKDEPFLAPGEFLLIDKFGNLIAGDEFEDVEDYRRELFIEEAPPVATMDSGAPPGDSMPPGYPTQGGTPGKKGKGGTAPGSAPPGMAPPGMAPPGMPGPGGGKGSKRGSAGKGA